MKKATIQPQPKPATQSAKATPAIVATTTKEQGSDKPDTPLGEGHIQNAFDIANAEMSEKVKDKVLTVSAVKQRLAEAKDAFNQGADHVKEGNAIAGEAGVKLYQAMTSGVIDTEETNAILRDVFGAKETSNGQPGKTPAGQGEVIRKRIVRAVAADEFVTNGGATSGFFKDLPPEAADEVQAVLDKLDADGSIWTAYDDLNKIKAKHRDKVNMAFDPAKIAAINESLGKPEAVLMLFNSTALFDEYRTLSKLLKVLGEGVTAMRLEEMNEQANDTGDGDIGADSEQAESEQLEAAE